MTFHLCASQWARDHVAFDIGVDRDNAIGALEAFLDGAVRRIHRGGRRSGRRRRLGAHATTLLSRADCVIENRSRNGR